ncbi:MAG: hypothetical protein HY833_03250 [Candidatus Aenigmarchaeota archaeon]|nr:hypothetical protein [Candidatus Aenigmarchaeota archaeon]
MQGTEFGLISRKIFDCDGRVRSVTFSRLDGVLVHSEMRPGTESLNPPGEIERKESEVLVPTLSSYFDLYRDYLGRVDYMGAKFEKVSMCYMRHRNVFVILSVEPGVSMSPIVDRVRKVLMESMGSPD